MEFFDIMHKGLTEYVEYFSTGSTLTIGFELTFGKRFSKIFPKKIHLSKARLANIMLIIRRALNSP